MNVCFTCFLSDLNVLFFVVGFVLGCLPGLGIADDYGQAVGVLLDVSCWHILVVGENFFLTTDFQCLSQSEIGQQLFFKPSV